MKKVAVCLLILLFCGPVCAEPFRLIVMPDSQNAVQTWPHLVTKMTEWIVKNRKQLNIQYVLHVGDMVQTGDDESQWRNFDASMKVLDGKVPYVLAMGNHDYGKAPGRRGRTLFDRYFPANRFEKLPHVPTASADQGNDYRTFHAADRDWLIVAMPFLPSEGQLDGADRVVAQHPRHRTIILTHSYLTHTGRDKSGERIWQKLVKKHANISLVFCGHLSTVHFVSQGDHGNKVYEMLFDWQNDRQPDPNSYFAIVTIDPEAATISVRSYSPALDKYLTDPRGQFEFRGVDFLREKAARAK
jgi:hypothetical protein